MTLAEKLEARGLEQGELEARYAIAKKRLKSGLEPQKVCLLTKLSTQVIARIVKAMIQEVWV